MEMAGNSGGTPAERTSFEIFAFRCVYATIAKGVAASILARPPMISGCRVLPRGGTLNLASLPLRRRTIPLSALTRLSAPQQPPWALRTASAVAGSLEPIADPYIVPDLPAAAVSPILLERTSTAPRAANNTAISRRALDEAIRSFRRSAQPPPPFVIVATALATTTVIPDSHQRPNAAYTAAALEDPRLSSIFRAEPNSDEYGSTVEPTWLYHAQEPSLLPDGPPLAFPLALPAHMRGGAAP